MASCRGEGRVILDKLRLCFKAEPQLLETLDYMEIGESIYFNELSLVRINEDLGYFNVYCSYQLTNDEEVYFGKLKFNQKIAGERGNLFKDGTQKAWVKVENTVLYGSVERLRFIYTVEKELKLTLNNFTKVEQCRDVSFNLPRLIKRYLHDPEITTILNRHIVLDRKEKRDEIVYCYSGNLDHQLKYLTVYIKQKEAVDNPNEGLTLKAYNKKHEIETKKMHKRYILDYHNNPKSLYRFEVEANSEETSLYFSRMHIPISLDILFNQEIMEDMYYYFLWRVLRFRCGAKGHIAWKDILDRGINKHPSQGKKMISR